MNRLMLLAALVLLGGRPALAGQRLVLFGGGSMPREAVDRFMEAAGGAKARLLMIPWATAVPQEYIQDFKDSIAPWEPASWEVAPSTAEMGGRGRDFLAQLERATGVFFVGGDQVRAADVLDRDPLLRPALRKRYRDGAVFGGTSAGTAVMSEVMLTGEGDFSVIDGSAVEVRPGLGLLPPDVIVDQHFIVRQRENRLFGVVLDHSGSLGLGIDEPCALVVDDGRRAQAFGPTQVMTVEAAGPASLRVGLLRSGERFDLKARKKS